MQHCRLKDRKARSAAHWRRVLLFRALLLPALFAPVAAAATEEELILRIDESALDALPKPKAAKPAPPKVLEDAKPDDALAQIIMPPRPKRAPPDAPPPLIAATPPSTEVPETPSAISLPPTGVPDSEAAARFQGRREQVVFASRQGVLSAEAIAMLTSLAGDLVANEVRVQIKSFSGTPEDAPSAASRESLKLALVVRDYLVGKGIADTRIIVRAQGAAAEGPTNRVDIDFLTR